MIEGGSTWKFIPIPGLFSKNHCHCIFWRVSGGTRLTTLSRIYTFSPKDREWMWIGTTSASESSHVRSRDCAIPIDYPFFPPVPLRHISIFLPPRPPLLHPKEYTHFSCWWHVKYHWCIFMLPDISCFSILKRHARKTLEPIWWLMKHQRTFFAIRSR